MHKIKKMGRIKEWTNKIINYTFQIYLTLTSNTNKTSNISVNDKNTTATK